MIYYTVFCITTCLAIMIRCQIPAWKKANLGSVNISPSIFWLVLILSNLVLAPIHFIVLLVAPRAYTQSIIEGLESQ